MTHSPTEEAIFAARKARADGDEGVVNALLAKAERLLTDGDLDGLVELWSAISMERMGEFDHLERDRKGQELLKRLAEAGNLPAQETLMIDFLEGLNGRVRDEAMFLHWSERAIKNGSLFASAERRKYLSRKKGAGEL